MLFLSGLHGSSHIVIYKVFINVDNYTMGHLHFDDACCQVNALHFAIDATAGYNFLTFGQRVLKLLNLLALLLLRANHEEIHDGKDSHHHNDKTHAPTLGTTGLCGEDNL